MIASKKFALLALSATLLLGGCQTLESINPFGGSSEDEDKVKGTRIALLPKNQEVLAQDPAYAGMAIAIPAPVPNLAWPFTEGNSGNIAGTAGLEIIWSVDAGVGTSSESAVTAQPVVADGRVFVLDAEAGLRAFDAASGALLWELSLVREGVTNSGGFFFGVLGGGDDAAAGWGGGVGYANGRVFVATGFGQVFGINASSGETLWTKTFETPFRAAPVARDGLVFVASRENKLYAFNEASGEEEWTHSVFAETAGILSSTAVAVDAETVVVPYTNGDLFALRSVNGRALWNDSLVRTGTQDTISSINDIASRPTIESGIVFAMGHSGRYVAIDGRTGERLWTRELAGTQTPWVAGEYVFAIGENGDLVAMEKRTGKVAWITYMGRWEDEEDRDGTLVWSGPVLVNGQLILVSSDGRIASVDAATGAKTLEAELPAAAQIAPAAANGTIYVLTRDAELVALR